MLLREDKTVTVQTRRFQPTGEDWFKPPVISTTVSVGKITASGRHATKWKDFTFTEDEYDRLAARQETSPALIAEHQPKGWLWWYRGRYFWATEPLSSKDVQALILQDEGRKRTTVEKAWVEVEGRGQSSKSRSGRRQSISESVRHEVWRRDGGACVDCESRDKLEFDHIIPVSEGGANTARNIELRCETCNRQKGARI